jgi:hypothetical protein
MLAEARERPLQVGRKVGRDKDDRCDPDRRLVEPRRHRRAGAVANGRALDDVRRRRRREGEVGPPVGNLPTRGLDLRPEPIGLRPVARLAGTRPGVRRPENLVRDPLSRHGPRIALAAAELIGTRFGRA